MLESPLISNATRALRELRPEPGLMLETIPVPNMAPGAISVKTRAATICGTDLHTRNDDAWAWSRLKPPLTTGHEVAGGVVAVGSDVKNILVEDCVGAESHFICGHCRIGEPHACKNTQIRGVDRDGCFAEYACLTAGNARLARRSLAPAASVQEPFGNAVHTAVTHEMIARAAGSSCTFATDTAPGRLETALQLGGDRVHVFDAADPDAVLKIMQATGNDGVDVLPEMSGQPAALRYGGRAALLGICSPADPRIRPHRRHRLRRGVQPHVRDATSNMRLDRNRADRRSTGHHPPHAAERF